MRAPGAKRKTVYDKQPEREFGEMIDGLALGDLQKRFLRERWLGQLRWFEAESARNQRRYYLLRLLIIVGGVIVPALVGLNLRGSDVANTIAWLAFAVSLVVAVAAAVETFFGYGARWRTFRRTAEALRSHGWQFFQLAGPYTAADHATAFPTFVAQVEVLVQEDVETFIALATQAQKATESHAPAGPGAGAG